MTKPETKPVTKGGGVAARRVAADALVRVDRQSAYANLLVPSLLDRSTLSRRDRAFVTELVYGTTRMRRACDFLVDRFTLRQPDLEARAWLRLGAYQICFTEVPDHAAVSATVAAAPRKLQGFLNAILRRVVDAPVEWPSDAVRLSYPDWIVDRLVGDLGRETALAALESMNQRPSATRRADGYTQDLASQWVAELVEPSPGSVVLDAAAAPGGKATAMAAAGATVMAADPNLARVGLVRSNRTDLRLDNLFELAADGRHPPFAPATFDRVLVDAPCSGLGVLRRRPDARWRIEASDVTALAALQRELIDALVPLVRPGGVLVYSVCTLTDAETVAVDDHLLQRHPTLRPQSSPGDPWEPRRRGALLLPQRAGTDGMFLLRLRVPE